MLSTLSEERRKETSEWDAVVRSAEERAAHLERENNVLQGELRRANGILQDVERGVFPIKEKDNLRSVILPLGQRAREVSVSELPYTSRYRSRVDTIVPKPDREPERERPRSSTSIPFASTGGYMSVSKYSSRQPGAPASTAAADNFVSGVGGMGVIGGGGHGAAEGGNLADMTKTELRDIVVRLRRELAEMKERGEGHYLENARSQLEELVINDLASHETVTYILSLERERDRYKAMLAEETKRARATKASLESFQRQEKKKDMAIASTLGSYGVPQNLDSARSSSSTSLVSSMRRAVSAANARH